MKSFLLYLFLLINLFSNFVTAEIILPADIVEGQDSNKSWIKNSHFEKNVNSVSSYSDSAGTAPVDGTGGSSTITCTRTTSSPISGDGSLLITKDAANRQGQGCSIPFTIDRGDRATIQTIVFPYEVASGTFVAGTDSTNSDLVMWVYDVTNSVLIPVQGTGRFYSNSSDYFYGYFQTNSNSTSYRLIFHQALTGTSAYGLKVDNIKIFRSKFSYGTTITDWATYTPSNTQGLGTIASVNLKWRRVGDTMQIQGGFTTGTVTASTAQLGLPSGTTISGTASTRAYVGETIRNGGSRITNFAIQGTTYLTFGGGASSHGDLPGSSAFGSAEALYITAFDIPIQGWSSSTQVSDGFNSRSVVFSGTQTSEAVTANVTNLTFTPVKNNAGAWNTNIFTCPASDDYLVVAGAITNTAGTALSAYKSSTLVGYMAAAYTSGATTGGAVLIPDCQAGQTISLRSSQSATITVGTLSIFKLSNSQTMSATERVSAIYSTTSQTITAGGTRQIVNASTKELDTHGLVTTGASWKFTAQHYGEYEIKYVSKHSSALVANTAEVLAEVYKNGAYHKALANFMQQSTNSMSPTLSGSINVILNSGDYIDIREALGGGVNISISEATIYISKKK